MLQMTSERNDCQSVQDMKSSDFSVKLSLLLFTLQKQSILVTVGTLVNFSGVKFLKPHKAQGVLHHHLPSTYTVLVFSMESAF